MTLPSKNRKNRRIKELGEQAARWLADQPPGTGCSEAGRRFGVDHHTVKMSLLRLGLPPVHVDRKTKPDRLKGAEAARWLAAQSGDVGYEDAARHFKLQAVTIKQSWKRLELGRTPRQKWWADKRATVIDLARANTCGSEIVKRVGVHFTLVYRWCKEAGVLVQKPNALGIQNGLEIVQQGGSIAEGARAANMDYGAFSGHMRRAKVKALPKNKQDPSKLKERRGRSEQAALLVKLEGFTIGHAAMIMEVAPSNVRCHMLQKWPKRTAEQRKTARLKARRRRAQR